MGSSAGPASRHALRGALVAASGLAALSCAGLIGIGERLADDGAPDGDTKVEVDAPDGAKVDVSAPEGTNAKERDASLRCEAQDGGFFGGHCYFTLAPATLEAAISACEAKGAHLATLTSEGEHTFVTAQWSRALWIGLRATPASNDRSKFAWITGEFVSSFDGWALDNPNDNSGCVMVRVDHLWADRPCSDLYEPLCEVD